MLDEADIVVGHNSNKFDVKRVNTRCLKHEIRQPSPYKKADTLMMAKRSFNISSNRLDFIGEFLGVGRKVSHEGFGLWKKVLQGDADAQKRMLDYNIGDVILLEQVYEKLRGWTNNHPSVVTSFDKPRCPVCGSEALVSVGSCFTNISEFRASECADCGAYSRSGSNLKTKDDMHNTQKNVV